MSATSQEQMLSDDTVVIVGGGPVGLILARVLSTYGIRSILFERNQSTTRWPKMDLTNARSMELFQKNGLADDLRKQGVPPQYDQNVFMSTGFHGDHILGQWNLPSVDKFRGRIAEHNDGSQPREPWQRISQAIFERWLKAVCDKDPLIDLRYGWKVLSLREESNAVYTTVQQSDGGEKTFVSRYAVGCDGGSSVVRKSIGSVVEGGPIPVRATLVHFKSKDLARLHKFGRFWHHFTLNSSGEHGGAVVCQDEADTFTTHLIIPADSDEDPATFTSEEIVYRVLGGVYGPYPIAIDEILVRSTWRPTIAITDSWAGPNLRTFLAGDAAHQTVPTGGYGMNTGVADAFDLGWKLAAVINKTGGIGLFKSYEEERRPVAVKNLQRAGEHFQVHQGLKEMLSGNPRCVDEENTEAEKLRSRIAQYYQEHDGENQDLGIELGYRYKSSIVVPDLKSPEPEWSPSKYSPTTWPGGRPPHLFLGDGTAMFDLFGQEWTLLIFADEDSGYKLMMDEAQALRIPLKVVSLAHEALAKKLYERNIVLIRPDQHVAWRADAIGHRSEARRVLEIVTGRESN